jgi:hypothetical protein
MGQSLHFAPVAMSSDRNPDLEKDKVNIANATAQPADHTAVANVSAGNTAAANKMTFIKIN